MNIVVDTHQAFVDFLLIPLVITGCSELRSISQKTVSITMGNNICNSQSTTSLSIVNFSNVKSINIGSDNLMYVKKFKLDELDNLKSVKIGMNSFTKEKNGAASDRSRSFSVLNCAKLESIDIGRYSFSDYAGGFELKNLPKLSTIKIGEIGGRSLNFDYCSFVIQGIIDVYIDNERSS